MRTYKICFREEYAMKGAVVETECGYPVKIVDYNAKCKNYPILALINKNGREIPVQYTKDGYTDMHIDNDKLNLVIIAEVVREHLDTHDICEWYNGDHRQKEYGMGATALHYESENMVLARY
jgi:hypothetical protein